MPSHPAIVIAALQYADTSIEEFSQEVKNALYQSHILDDYRESSWRTKPELELKSRFDAFWQPYLTYKIMRKNWDDTILDGRTHRATERLVQDMPHDARRRFLGQMSPSELKSEEKLNKIELYRGIYRAAERLLQVSHPEERSKEISHEVLKQYIYAFCSHPRRILKEARITSMRYKTCAFSGSLYFLEMALVNDCQEGIRSALNDPAVDDMFSHIVETECRHAYLCNHYITATAAECGNLVLLTKIFSSPNFQPRQIVLQRLVFDTAVEKGLLDVVKFIMDPCKHSSDFDPRYDWCENAICSGVLRSRSVDFCSQLFQLLASQLENNNGLKRKPRGNRRLTKSYFEYSNILRIVAWSSPQRADVAEWLLDRGASASLTVQGERRLVTSNQHGRRLVTGIQCGFWTPLERAVKGGNEKIVRLLLDRGPALDTFQTTCCYEEAAKQGRLDIMRMLVEYNARVAPRLLTVCRELHWRCTLMMHAVRTENEGLCRYLAEHGACISDSALNVAIDESLVSMVQLLLELGAIVTEHNIQRAKLLRRPRPAVPRFFGSSKANHGHIVGRQAGSASDCQRPAGRPFPHMSIMDIHLDQQPIRKFQYPYGSLDGGRYARMYTFVTDTFHPRASEVITLLEAHNNAN
jgi:hypothetical protein